MPYPPKLTEDSLKELVGLVRSGVPIKTALQSKGINDRAAWRWLRNGQERPGSIYGAFREQLLAAEAEKDVIRIQVLTNASTRTSKRVTTVTKHQARKDGDQTVMDPTEQTTTTVEFPPDPQWAWRMLQATNPTFRPNVEVTTGTAALPRDMMARTIAERLRLVQGGGGPSMLEEGDEEARRLMGGP